LRYDVSTPTLANVAAERDWQSPADHRHDESYESPCQQVRDRGLGPDGIRFLSPLAPPIESETRPINYRAFFDALDPSEQGALRTVESLGTIAGRLAGRTVFLGGTYGATDKYLTPIGVLDGVMIHAAAFHSRRHPIREARQYAYLFEIVVGVLLCYFFTYYGTVTTDIARTGTRMAPSGPGVVRSGLWPRTWRCWRCWSSRQSG
jgi:hypothetical protein